MPGNAKRWAVDESRGRTVAQNQLVAASMILNTERS